MKITPAILAITFMANSAAPFSVANAQQNPPAATQQAAEFLPPIQIPNGLKIVKVATNTVLSAKNPDGTEKTIYIELPKNGAHIRTLPIKWKTQEGKQESDIGTFMSPDVNGRFPIPPESRLMVGSPDAPRKTIAEPLAFYAPPGTDIIHVIPNIQYTPHQNRGMLFPLEVDLLFNLSATPAYVAQYHPLEDRRGMTEQQQATVTALHRNTRPPEPGSNEEQDFHYFVNHIFNYHNVTGNQIQLGIFQGMRVRSQQLGQNAQTAQTQPVRSP